MDAALFYLERRKALEPINARINEFRAKCNVLVETYESLIHELANTEDNRAKHQLKRKISNVLGELEIARDLEDNLIELRYKYT